MFTADKPVQPKPPPGVSLQILEQTALPSVLRMLFQMLLGVERHAAGVVSDACAGPLPAPGGLGKRLTGSYGDRH